MGKITEREKECVKIGVDVALKAQEKSQTDLGDEKIEKLRYINSLMREMLEFQRRGMTLIGIRPAKFPDFVYEVV